MDSTLGSIGFEQRARNVAGTLADFAQIRPASTHISLLTNSVNSVAQNFLRTCIASEFRSCLEGRLSVNASIGSIFAITPSCSQIVSIS